MMRRKTIIRENSPFVNGRGENDFFLFLFALAKKIGKPSGQQRKQSRLMQHCAAAALQGFDDFLGIAEGIVTQFFSLLCLVFRMAIPENIISQGRKCVNQRVVYPHSTGG